MYIIELVDIVHIIIMHAALYPFEDNAYIRIKISHQDITSYMWKKFPTGYCRWMQ